VSFSRSVRSGTCLALVVAVLSWSHLALAGVGAGPSQHAQCHHAAAPLTPANHHAAHVHQHASGCCGARVQASACCPLHSALQPSCTSSICCEAHRQPVPAVDRDRIAPRALRHIAVLPAQSEFADLRENTFQISASDFVHCYSPPVLAQKEDLRI